MMISYKCLENIESMLLTFKEICRIHLTKYPNGYVVPSRINSDIVENHFCQQRGMLNGCNTHPTYSNYCTTVNSVILGQSLKSRGRKSNTGLSAASCYNISTNMSHEHKPNPRQEIETSKRYALAYLVKTSLYILWNGGRGMLWHAFFMMFIWFLLKIIWQIVDTQLF